MKKAQPFMHPIRGKGRPQIVLIGNGLKRKCPPTRPDPKGRTDQLSWADLLDRIKDIGGASVLINYGFRNMTTDVDAMISGASAMKDAIHRVGDRYGLPNGWLNSDFTHTDSYTPKLAEHAKHYRTFANVLSIYTVSAEYLIAMKLRSGRQYKNDLSDVLGIFAEHEKNGAPISMERIRTAVTDLYGAWDALPESSRNFISNVMGMSRRAAKTARRAGSI